MAYATIDDVLAITPSLAGTDAETAAEAVLEAASTFVDRYTGRSWAVATVTGEVRTVLRGEIRTTRYPVTAVSSLSVRLPLAGASSTVLVSGSTYDLLDASIGRVAVSAMDGSLATIAYTAAPSPPADIVQATALLAAHWARGAVDNSGATFSKIKAGSVELVYREQTERLPMDIKAILDGYRPAFAFA